MKVCVKEESKNLLQNDSITMGDRSDAEMGDKRILTEIEDGLISKKVRRKS